MMHVYQGNDELLMHRHKKSAQATCCHLYRFSILCKAVILPAYWYMYPGI